MCKKNIVDPPFPEQGNFGPHCEKPTREHPREAKNSAQNNPCSDPSFLANDWPSSKSITPCYATPLHAAPHCMTNQLTLAMILTAPI